MSTSQANFKQRGVDYQVTPVMLTLPREFYQTEEIYREELEKIFYKRWLLACREEEIPKAGDFLVVPVGDESIIVVRDEQGEIQAHFNVCRHRGTRLCSTEKGKFESGFIQCPYHAWSYDMSGNLKAAAQMKDLPGFRFEEYGLFGAHVRTWGGFVFINLAKHPTPFEESMGALLGKFKDWNLPQLRIAHKIEYPLNCNWKLILQNYQECYHCPGVHPMLSKRTPFRSGVHDCMDGSVLGGYMTLCEGQSSMTMDGAAAGPPVCNVRGEYLQRIYYYSIFPNALLSPHPDFVLYHRIRSFAYDKIQVDCFFLMHPDAIAQPGSMERLKSAVEFWDLTNRQDWDVCEEMQKGLKSQRFVQGRYAPQEDIPYALDQEILRALGRTR